MWSRVVASCVIASCVVSSYCTDAAFRRGQNQARRGEGVTR